MVLLRLLFLLCGVTLAHLSSAASLNLAWDASPSPEATGYFISYGTATRNYPNKVNVGTTRAYTAGGLLDGTTYYFAATAYDANGAESGYSNELVVTTPAAPPPPPPAAPVANFTTSSTTGVAPLSVTFSNTSTGSITGYAWTFGDGATSAVASPTHSYAAGSYTATLTVTGSGGSGVKTVSVTASAPAPVASFTTSGLTGAAPYTVTFTNTSTNPTAYSWTFGDGTSSTVASPSHVYSAAGTYQVSLVVTGAGGSSTASATVTVNTAPPGPVCPCSVFTTQTPSNPNAYDPSSVELGMKFTSDVTGFVSGVKFYKGSRNTGTHAASLWSASGTLLARATFTAETYSGWQTVSFATKVAIQAGTTYVVSYHVNSSYYAYSPNYFTAGVNNPPLHAPISAGVYRYGSVPIFPNATYNATNYWVDVVVVQ